MFKVRNSEEVLLHVNWSCGHEIKKYISLRHREAEQDFLAAAEVLVGSQQGDRQPNAGSA